MKRFFFLSFATLSFTLLGVFFTSSSASAVSVYDDIIQIQNPPYQITNYSGNTVIHSSNDPYALGQWFATLSNTGDGNCGSYTYNAFLSQAIGAIGNNHKYAVAQSSAPWGVKSLRFIVDIAGDAQVDQLWSSSSKTLSINMSGSHVSSFVLQGDTNNQVLTCAQNTSISSTIMSIATNPGADYARVRPIETNIAIEYPNDYDGVEIPVATPPTPDSKYTPDFKIYDKYNFNIQISDYNFFTFDNVPFTCDGGFAPILNYEIWDRGDLGNTGDEQLLHSGQQSASGMIVYEFPVEMSDKYYRIIGWYSGCDDRNFTESDFLDFTMTRYGTIYQPLFTQCIIPDFPWFDLESCIDNFQVIISMLSFNGISFNDSWNIQGQCYQMTTLHHWIHSPQNSLICAQIPAYVRNIVTPFVTFFLGLITVRIFTRRTDI